MIDYEIAIPSYKRPETIKKKTLKVLEGHNIPPEKINIFVANEEEFDRSATKLHRALVSRRNQAYDV